MRRWGGLYIIRAGIRGNDLEAWFDGYFTLHVRLNDFCLNCLNFVPSFLALYER